MTSRDTRYTATQEYATIRKPDRGEYNIIYNMIYDETRKFLHTHKPRFYRVHRYMSSRPNNILSPRSPLRKRF